jgi:hypothetical protein
MQERWKHARGESIQIAPVSQTPDMSRYVDASMMCSTDTQRSLLAQSALHARTEPIPAQFTFLQYRCDVLQECATWLGKPVRFCANQRNLLHFLQLPPF